MRYGLDILMLLLLVAEMTFFYLPPLLHEVVGVTFLLPIAGHLTLNRRYIFSLSRGQWHGPRVLRLLLNFLLAAACLVTVISGCLISSELFSDIVPFSLRSKPLLYQLHSAAARYFLVLAGLHFGLQRKAWGQKWLQWLHFAGITARPFPAQALLGGLAMIVGAVGFYAAQQDRLLGHLQGAHIFMTPSLSYSGVGYALIQVSIFFCLPKLVGFYHFGKERGYDESQRIFEASSVCVEKFSAC